MNSFDFQKYFEYIDRYLKHWDLKQSIKMAIEKCANGKIPKKLEKKLEKHGVEKLTKEITIQELTK